MQLQYLLFDSSDEDSGRCSFDAMAAVPAARLPAVLQEVEAVLAWAASGFGPPGDEAGWDHALQSEADPASGLHVVTLTIAGPPQFCEAFRQAFDAS